jgi:hypothetical protein
LHQATGCSPKICCFIEVITCLLVVKIHTFPPFGDITNIITLANRMANHITHSFKQNRMVYYHHSPPKKCQGKDNMWWGTHVFKFKMSWTFKTSHAIYVSSSNSLGVAMLSHANGPLGIKIKPTTNLKSSTKFYESN